MLIEILYPNEWSGGLCDSYEARVCLSKTTNSFVTGLMWAAGDAMEYLRSLDPIHGKRFLLYKDGAYCGEIWTETRDINLEL